MMDAVEAVSETSPRRRFAWSDPPIPGESLLGFVARNAEKHGVTDMVAVLDAAGIETLKPSALPTLQFEAAADIAYLFGTSEEEIASRFYSPVSLPDRSFACVSFFGTHMRSDYRVARRRRVSPASLAISPHHRAIWDVRPLTFCPESKELLIDACPSCKAGLGWRWTLGIHRCESCGADLRDFPQPKVAVPDGIGLDVVAGILDPVVSGQPETIMRIGDGFVTVSRGDQFEFAMALGWAFSDPSAPRRLRKFHTVEDFDRLRPADLAAAGDLIADWDMFPQMAERFREHRDARPRFWGVQKEMGRLAAVAVDLFLPKELKQIVERSLTAVMEGASLPIVGSKVDKNDGSLVSISEAASLIGVARETIVAWREQGLVDLISQDDAKVSIKLMRREDVDAIVAERDGAISRVATEELLGIGASGVSALSAAGLLRRIEGPAASPLRMEHYPRAQVVDLIERLKKAAIPMRPDFAGVPLREAIAEANLGQTAWSLVFEAALEGRINLTARSDASFDPLVDSLMIPSVQALLPLRPTTRLLEPEEAAEFLSVGEASAFLNISGPMVNLLMKRGLLRRRAGAKQNLHRADLYWFQQKYMMTAEAGRLLGVSGYGSVPKLLADLGIEPAHRLTDDGDLVWNRREVECALGLRPAADRQPKYDAGPGVLIPVEDSRQSLSVFVTNEAILRVDPTWTDELQLPVVEAKRELFESLARRMASEGRMLGDGKVRIEKEDVPG